MSPTNESGIVTHQRYYYAIALDFGRSRDRDVGKYLRSARAPGQWSKDLTLPDVRFFGWETALPFGAAESHEQFLVKRRSNGTGLYHYDFFAAHLKLGRRSIVVLAFPFVRLGQVVLQEMVKNGLLKDASFIRTSAQSVVNELLSGKSLGGRIRIAKLVTRVEDDAVRRLVLGGQDAIHSRIYRLLLREFGKATFGARHCIIALQTKDGSGTLSAHIDNFGNYRFWLQTGLKNVPTLPELFQYLDESGALEISTSIPYERMELDEGAAGEL